MPNLLELRTEVNRKDWFPNEVLTALGRPGRRPYLEGTRGVRAVDTSESASLPKATEKTERLMGVTTAHWFLRKAQCLFITMETLAVLHSTLEPKTRQELSEPLPYWELLQLGRILGSEAQGCFS